MNQILKMALNKIIPFFLLFFLQIFFSTNALYSQVYKDKTQAIPIRVNDLLSRMTFEEKCWQVFMITGNVDNVLNKQYQHSLFGIQLSASAKGDAGGQLINYNVSESVHEVIKKINAVQKYFVEQTRLGIPIIPYDEALHGLVRNDATAFPQSIALAATFDTSLMHQVANQIALQTKLRGIRQILSPVINIASDVRWGRTEETYGEDPFLTAAMGVAFVTEFESKGMITTPKHFVANVGDGGRDSYPIHMNERIMEEIYLYPFKELIQKGGARSIMTSYNSVDGVAASANKSLLENKLKKEWRFKGFVISDANAVGGELVLHNTAKSYQESGEHAINGGLDVIFQINYEDFKLFFNSLKDSRIDTNRLNDAVKRVLTAKFDLGLFENPYVPENVNFDITTSKNIARKAARESFVLLKNENNTLPLSKQTKTIAVVGSDAIEARLGGYSGPGMNKVSILKGIQQKFKSSEVLYAEGSNRMDDEYSIVPSSQLSYNGKEGLQAFYFSNINLNEKPFTSRVDKVIDFRWTLFGPTMEMTNDFYAVQWNGFYTAHTTGVYKIGLEGNDGYRLFINDQLVINRWQKISYSRTLINYSFKKNKPYRIRIEFYENGGNATIKLIQQNKYASNWKQKIAKAVAIAKKSDAVIAVVGIDEGEFQDRAMLHLPGHQEDLLDALSNVGKPITVLLVGGSAVTMKKWKEKVQAIACVWYPGEEGGHGVADVLVGDYNPAARLPITFPLHEGQLPLVYNHKPTGRGDDYINLSGHPLYPFGFGLSYTNFEYSNLKFSKNPISMNEQLTVSVEVKNSGKKDGEEVVQLYIRDILSSVARPVMELKGFQKIFIKAGETKKVEFEIKREHLQMLDINLNPIVEPGEFRIMIGASSKDISLKSNLIVTPY